MPDKKKSPPTSRDLDWPSTGEVRERLKRLRVYKPQTSKAMIVGDKFVTIHDGVNTITFDHEELRELIDKMAYYLEHGRFSLSDEFNGTMIGQ